jgi:hypothetical protein
MDEIQKVLVKAGRKDLAQKYYLKVAQIQTLDPKNLAKEVQDSLDSAADAIKKTINANYGNATITKHTPISEDQKRFLSIPIEQIIFTHHIHVEADWFGYGGGDIQLGVGSAYKSVEGTLGSGSADVGSIHFHAKNNQWSGTRGTGELLADLIEGKRKITLASLFKRAFHYSTYLEEGKSRLNYEGEENLKELGKDKVQITLSGKIDSKKVDIKDFLKKEIEKHLERDLRHTKIDVSIVNISKAKNYTVTLQLRGR